MKSYLLNMLTLLLNFLPFFSYNYLLLHPCLIEANSLLSSDGFTIDLVHRYYNPKSPVYNSLLPKEIFRRLFLSSASRYYQIKLQQNPIQGEVDTILTPNLGDYVMQLNVGTPPVQLAAVAVTGTDFSWFQCEPCSLCYQQNTTIFDTRASVSYQTLPCDTKYCTNIDPIHINCDQSDNVCRYWYTYGNSTSATQGFMGSDTFFFDTPDGSDRVPFPSIAFGCGNQQRGEFDTDTVGVVGLGNGALSLVSQMGPAISYKFSYCLTFVTSTTPSKFRFGGGLIQDPSKQVGAVSIPLLSNNGPSTFYNLGLNGITVGQTSISVNKEIIMDIGTTLTYLNPSTYYNLEAMVTQAIGATPISNNPVVDDLTCYDSMTAPLSPPDIVFHLIGGDIVFKSNNIFFAIDTYLCLTIVKSQRDGDPMVLGNMAQVNFQVEIDQQNQSVNFTPVECAFQNV